jgi:hypothetical protein
MSDVSDPLLTCDADVVGSGVALNNRSMHVDMDVDVTGENTHSPRRLSSPVATSALSGFFSMIEYVTRSVLIDIAKHHNVQLPLGINLEILCLLLYLTCLLVNVLKLTRAHNLFLKARHM